VSGEAASYALDHLTFGRLVTRPGGPAEAGAQAALTTASAGLDAIARAALLPARLMEPSAWQPEDIAPESRARGALLIRHVAIGADLPSAVAIMRLRFRGEAGEAEGGRLGVQARILIASRAVWSAHRADIVGRVAPGLAAEPDVTGHPERLRLAAGPQMVDAPAPDDPPVAELPGALWPVLLALVNRFSVRLGPPAIPDEAAFLRLSARVVDILPAAIPITIAAGFANGLPQAHLSYCGGEIAAEASEPPPLARALAARGAHLSDLKALLAERIAPS